MRERRYPIWEGEAPAEPQQSLNGTADSDSQLTIAQRRNGRYRAGLAYKRYVIKTSLHVCHGVSCDISMAHRGSAGASPSQVTEFAS